MEQGIRAGAARCWLGRREPKKISKNIITKYAYYEVKKAQAFLLALSILTFSTTLPPEAKAGRGCDSTKARAYSVNLSTKAKSQVDFGEVTECQSMQGSFQSFAGKRLDFGWANCVTNCEKGFKPAEIYVRVGNTFKPGSHKRDGWDKTCMQQLGSATMYCLEAL